MTQPLKKFPTGIEGTPCRPTLQMKRDRKFLDTNSSRVKRSKFYRSREEEVKSIHFSERSFD